MAPQGDSCHAQQLTELKDLKSYVSFRDQLMSNNSDLGKTYVHFASQGSRKLLYSLNMGI